MNGRRISNDDFYDGTLFELADGRHVVRSYGLETILGEDNSLGVFLADEKGKCLDWHNLTEDSPWPDWLKEVVDA